MTIIIPANVNEIKNIGLKHYKLYSRGVLFNAKVTKACSFQPWRHTVKHKTQHQGEINRYLI
jgi:hypothetical protein